jgi:hypothetical protein
MPPQTAQPAYLQILWHGCAALLQRFYQVWRVPLLIGAYEGDGRALVAGTPSAANPAVQNAVHCVIQSQQRHMQGSQPHACHAGSRLEPACY